jgi:HAD superfamily hydrolase (TIGR01509 family)
MTRELTAVFFDVGNTLLFPDRTRILAPLDPPRITSSLAHWHEIERATKKKFDDLIERDGLVDHGFWFLFYSQLLETLGLQDNAIRDSLVGATRISANWCDIRPGTREALERIRKNYPLGVISNADGSIDRVLERCGIADCFQSITDSGVVGYEKPNPAIFQAALASIGADARHSLYVGDVYSVDYLGATRAGMKAILFDVAGAYRGRKLPRVESLEQLEATLQRPEPGLWAFSSQSEMT